MKTVRELIDEAITPEAIQHKIQFAKKWGLQEDAEFFSNLYTNLKELIRMGIQHKKYEGLIGDPFMLNVQVTYEVIGYFKQSLMESNGQLTYPEDNWNLAGRGDNNIINSLLDECEKQNVILETIKAKGNYWNYKEGKRICKQDWVYRLRSESGSWMSIELPEEGHNVIYVKMFKVPKEKRGNGLYSLKEFKRYVNILWNMPEIHTLRSPCLAAPEEDDKEKIDSWRFKRHDLGGRYEDTYGLMIWWSRIGGCNIRIEGENLDELFFAKYEQAMIVKESFKEEGLENPYRLLSNYSIYTREQAEELRAEYI